MTRKNVTPPTSPRTPIQTDPIWIAIEFGAQAAYAHLVSDAPPLDFTATTIDGMTHDYLQWVRDIIKHDKKLHD